MTQAASASSLTAGQSAEAMAPAVRRLSERSTGVLKQAGSRERRSSPREPVRMSGRLIQPGREPIEVETLDLSIKGAMLHVQASEAWTGSPVELELQDVGSFPVQFRRITDEGTIVAFRPEPAADMRSRLANIVAASREANQSHVPQLTAAAADLSALLTEAVSGGTVALSTLITVDYQRIAGTEPTQYTTGALPFYEKVLPEFLARCSSAIEGSLLMMASDRNGYVPVHPSVLLELSKAGTFEWVRFWSPKSATLRPPTHPDGGEEPGYIHRQHLCSPAARPHAHLHEAGRGAGSRIGPALGKPDRPPAALKAA